MYDILDFTEIQQIVSDGLGGQGKKLKHFRYGMSGLLRKFVKQKVMRMIISRKGGTIDANASALIITAIDSFLFFFGRTKNKERTPNDT